MNCFYFFRKLATVLVQRGKLLINSIILAGTAWGKVRKILDHQNNVLQEANPSDAIQIIGWKDLPQSGQEFLQVSTDVLFFHKHYSIIVVTYVLNIINYYYRNVHVK